MRAMFTVTSGLLICLGLMGCNRSQQAQATAPAPVVAAAPVCNCPQQAAALPVVRTSRRHKYHRHAWSVPENSSFAESYDVSADSSSSDENTEGEYDSNRQNGQAPAPVQVEAEVWIDGYGRGHYASAASDDTNPASLSPDDDGRRHAPWHAYNSDCDRVR